MVIAEQELEPLLKQIETAASGLHNTQLKWGCNSPQLLQAVSHYSDLINLYYALKAPQSLS